MDALVYGGTSRRGGLAASLLATRGGSLQLKGKVAAEIEKE